MGRKRKEPVNDVIGVEASLEPAAAAVAAEPVVVTPGPSSSSLSPPVKKKSRKSTPIASRVPYDEYTGKKRNQPTVDSHPSPVVDSARQVFSHILRNR